MGIYIKDFKMPEGGYRTIEIGYDADGHPMAITDGGDAFDVISVPSHGNLIDRDALYEDCALDNRYEVAATTTRINEYMQLKIDAAPTVIPAEQKGE